MISEGVRLRTESNCCRERHLVSESVDLNSTIFGLTLPFSSITLIPCFKTLGKYPACAWVNHVRCDSLRTTEREILCPQVHETPAGPAATCDSCNANTYSGSLWSDTCKTITNSHTHTQANCYSYSLYSEHALTSTKTSSSLFYRNTSPFFDISHTCYSSEQ